LRLFLALNLFLACAMPSVAQEASGPITTENSAQQDAAIAICIREILTELEIYEDVAVNEKEGVVTLRGTTTSSLEASELDPLAARVEGVVAVRNQVTETTDLVRRLDPAMDRFRAQI
jgi:osmotically-inducible protein OsmY